MAHINLMGIPRETTQLWPTCPHRAWQSNKHKNVQHKNVQLQYGKSLELHEMWGIHYYANLECTCWNLNSVVFTIRCSVVTWIIDVCRNIPEIHVCSCLMYVHCMYVAVSPAPGLAERSKVGKGRQQRGKGGRGNHDGEKLPSTNRRRRKRELWWREGG